MEGKRKMADKSDDYVMVVGVKIIATTTNTVEKMQENSNTKRKWEIGKCAYFYDFDLYLFHI